MSDFPRLAYRVGDTSHGLARPKEKGKADVGCISCESAEAYSAALKDGWHPGIKEALEDFEKAAQRAKSQGLRPEKRDDSE